MILVHNSENHVFIRVSFAESSGGIRARSEKDMAMSMRALKATVTGGNELGRLEASYHGSQAQSKLGKKHAPCWLTMRGETTLNTTLKRYVIRRRS